jgi:hypothetical protein
MATYAWTGLALADGTTITSANLNTAGNGDAMVYQSIIGAATRVARQETHGNGFEITGTTIGDSARTDTATVSSGASGFAASCVYQAPSTPGTVGNYFLLGRNSNATAATSGNVQHTTSNFIEFRTAADAVATSAVSGSATTARTPALVSGDDYQVDTCLILNTTTTPSTTNGRILGRVQSISAPGTWNGGVEFWFDSGYTTNVTTDPTNLWRTGKVLTTGTVGLFRLLNLKWRDVTTPNTSLTKTNAITNFVTVTGPTVSSTGTGKYPIIAIGTPVVAGALSYSISQTGGTTHAATQPVSGVGIFLVDQDSSSATTYDVTITETGGGSTVSTYTVPALTTLTAGQLRIRRQVAGVLT